MNCFVALKVARSARRREKADRSSGAGGEGGVFRAGLNRMELNGERCPSSYPSVDRVSRSAFLEFVRNSHVRAEALRRRCDFRTLSVAPLCRSARLSIDRRFRRVAETLALITHSCFIRDDRLAFRSCLRLRISSFAMKSIVISFPRT